MATNKTTTKSGDTKKATPAQVLREQKAKQRISKPAAPKVVQVPETSLYRLFCEAGEGIYEDAQAVEGLGAFVKAFVDPLSSADPEELSAAAAVIKAQAGAIIDAASRIIARAESLKTLADVRSSDPESLDREDDE